MLSFVPKEVTTVSHRPAMEDLRIMEAGGKPLATQDFRKCETEDTIGFVTSIALDRQSGMPACPEERHDRLIGVVVRKAGPVRCCRRDHARILLHLVGSTSHTARIGPSLIPP